MSIRKLVGSDAWGWKPVSAINQLIDGNMVVQDNGVDVEAMSKLNFTNATSITVDRTNNRIDITLPAGGGGGGAPTTADYLVKTADASLSAERVVTDTTTVTWDWATAGQAKATVPNLSGTNTGDQTITLTGDVTGSGTGSFAATIANDAVTYAKMQNVSTASVLLGRGSAGGAGDAQEISLGTGLSMSGTTVSAPVNYGLMVASAQNWFMV